MINIIRLDRKIGILDRLSIPLRTEFALMRGRFCMITTRSQVNADLLFSVC
jgi:hypothetical protein